MRVSRLSQSSGVLSVNSISRRTALEVFHEAETFVKTNYPRELAEVHRFLDINPEHIGKTDFFIQYTHVVYCSGFKYSVVVKNWDKIADAWCQFDPYEVAENIETCKEKASQIINHQGKIKAIADTAQWLSKISGTYLTRFILDAQKKIDLFKRLGYIGDVTKYHLGICMGFDVIKPDVHLQRIADHFNLDPFEMCDVLSQQTGHPKRVVDAILWRASEQGSVHLSSKPKDDSI